MNSVNCLSQILSSVSLLVFYDIELCDFQIPLFYFKKNLFAFSAIKTKKINIKQLVLSYQNGHL